LGTVITKVVALKLTLKFCNMKIKLPIAISLLFWMSSASVHAQVLIVNNNDTRPPEHYSSLLDAVNAASAGDTIYIIGSPYSYGLNWWDHVTKPLVIFGTGYNPQKDNTQISRISQISFDGDGSGSVARGLVVDFLSDWLGFGDNIEISDCMIFQGIDANNNWLIYHNIFQPPSWGSGTMAPGVNPDKFCTIRNNIFNNWLGYGNLNYGTLADYDQDGNIVENNLFIGRPPGYGTYAFGAFRYASIVNNIFYGVAPDAPNGQDANLNDFARNLTYQTDHDSIPANNTQSDINFISQNPDFVDSIALWQNQLDFTLNYHLKTSSPGHNAGTDGTDLGIYGGDDAFRDFIGFPPIPQITLMNIVDSNIAGTSPVILNITAIANGQGNLNAAEYFFDHDLGDGNCTDVAITHGNNISLSIQIPQSLAPGIHLLGFRVRNIHGSWSFPEMRIVNVCGAAIVTPPGPITLCKSQSVTLNAYEDGAGVIYQWKKGNNSIAGETNSTYTATKTGTFKCIVTNACGSTTSNSVSVTVNAQPAATVTAPNGLDLCNMSSVLLQANSGAGYSYQWEKGNANISGATNQSYSATTKGTYKVIVTNSNGCNKTSAGKKVIKSCREESFSVDDTQLSVFPNPSDGKFSVQFSSDNIQDASATIQLFNVTGQMVFEENTLMTDGQLRKEISLSSSLPAGIYFLQVKVNDEVYTEKVVLEK
jgi:methionine-rich copper-binding protein CopC